jgi:hypothetical protein
MQFIRQPYTVNYMNKDFDVYVLYDDTGKEFRIEGIDSYNIAHKKRREVKDSEDFRRFQTTYNPNGPKPNEEYKDTNVRLEVDPYEDEGAGFTIRLYLTFKLESDVLPINLSSGE